MHYLYHHSLLLYYSVPNSDVYSKNTFKKTQIEKLLMALGFLAKLLYYLYT